MPPIIFTYGASVLVNHLSRFDEFRSLIDELDVAQSYDRSQILTPQFQLGDQDRLKIYYAPFDYINTQARIALVGVTPGWTQMQRSFVVARAQMEQGADETEILREVKRVAAFSGTLRKNLVAMLDGIGLADALGIPSSGALFGPQGEWLLHSTSAIRYPVFKSGENYSGRNPFITKVPLLAAYVEGLAQELEAVPNALVVPMGKAVESVIKQLIDEDSLDRSRVMVGFPHPSGASPHRLRFYEESREVMSRIVEEWASRLPLQ